MAPSLDLKIQISDIYVTLAMLNEQSNVEKRSALVREAPPVSEAALSIERPRAARLWGELFILFIALPVVAATSVSPKVAINAFIVMTIIGVGLLLVTDGFRWRSLLEGGVAADWPFVLVFSLGTALISAAMVLWLVPHRFLAFPQEMPGLWVKVMFLYPLLSVLAQELFFRVLFFERYGQLFPGAPLAIAANGVCFGLAHAFLANWPAVVLTTVGGVVFAWAYVERRSFALACVLHAVAGQIIFTVGLGLFFYHGAVGRL